MRHDLTPTELAAELASHLTLEERAVVDAAGYGRASASVIGRPCSSLM